MWSDELHDPGTEINSFIAGDNGMVYLVRDHASDHYSINTISPTLQTDEEKDLVYEEKNQKLTVSDVFHLKNQLACIGFTADNGKFNIVVFPIDPKTLEQTQPSQTVFSIEKRGGAYFYMKKYYSPLNGHTYNYAISPDQTKVVVYNKPEEDNANPYSIDVVVFDETLKKLWSKTIQVPVKEGKFILQNVVVDNSGNVYAAGLMDIPKTKSSPSNSYSLLLGIKDGAALQTSKLDLGGKMITSLGLTFDKSNNLICAGFYSDKSMATTSGVYYLLMDAGLKSVKQQSKDITDDLKNKMFEASQRKDHDIPTLPLIYISVQDNGNLIFAGQHSSVSSYSTTIRTIMPTGAGQTSTTSTTTPNITFFASGVVVVNLDPDGQLKYFNLVPIAQKGPYPDYLGCAVQVYNGRVFVIYNDNPKNETVMNGYTLEYYDGTRGNSIVTMAAVNTDGSLEKFELISNKDLETTLVPKRSQTVADNKLLIYGDRVKNYKLGMIAFK